MRKKLKELEKRVEELTKLAGTEQQKVRELTKKTEEPTELADPPESPRMQSILDRIEAVRLFKERMAADTYKMTSVKDKRQTPEPVEASCRTSIGSAMSTGSDISDDSRELPDFFKETEHFSKDDYWKNSENHSLKETRNTIEYYNIFNEDDDSSSEDDSWDDDWE